MWSKDRFSITKTTTVLMGLEIEVVRGLRRRIMRNVREVGPGRVRVRILLFGYGEGNKGGRRVKC